MPIRTTAYLSVLICVQTLFNRRQVKAWFDASRKEKPPGERVGLKTTIPQPTTAHHSPFRKCTAHVNSSKGMTQSVITYQRLYNLCTAQVKSSIEVTQSHITYQRLYKLCTAHVKSSREVTQSHITNCFRPTPGELYIKINSSVT